MLTRVAESIYSIHRYIERADNTARLVNVTFNLFLDFPHRDRRQWQSLIEIAGDPSFQERYEQLTPETATQFLIFDQENSHSLVSGLQAAREKARTIRQYISEEVWQQINTFSLMVKNTDSELMTGEFIQFLAAVQRASYLFFGAMHETMSHDEGWHFGRVGRLLERVEQASCLLGVQSAELLARNDSDIGQELSSMALLRSAGAYEMYRKHHHRFDSSKMIEFLILNGKSPRSIRFCLGEAAASLQEIRRILAQAKATQVERSLNQLLSQLDDLSIEEIRSELPEFLDNLRQQSNAINHQLSNTFFAVETAN